MEGVLEGRLREHVRRDGIVAEDLAGARDVAPCGEDELGAIGQGEGCIGRCIPGGGLPETAGVVEPAEAKQHGLAGAGGPFVGQEGDGACDALFPGDTGPLDHEGQLDPLGPFAGSEAEDVIIGNKAVHGGDHGVHVAAGVVPQVNHGAADVVGDSVQYALGIADAGFLVTGEGRQRNDGDAVLYLNAGIGPFAGGVLCNGGLGLEEGVLAAGDLEGFPDDGLGLFEGGRRCREGRFPGRFPFGPLGKDALLVHDADGLTDVRPVGVCAGYREDGGRDDSEDACFHTNSFLMRGRRPSSAGSQLTSCSSSAPSQRAASCSFRCRASLCREHM